MKIIHHTDHDGKCSGAIVRRKYPEAELISYNYGQFPLNLIRQHEKVIIVDCSLKPADMILLIHATNPGIRDVQLALNKANIIWINHHKTAIEEYLQFPYLISGIRKVGTSGCLLTWRYFFPDTSIPAAVKWINDYDLWIFNLENTKNFCAGLKYFNTHPSNDELWQPLLTTDEYALTFAYEIIEKGKIINVAEAQRWKGYSKAFGFTATWKNYNCLLMNTGGANLAAFGELTKEYDIVIAFVYKHPIYHVTMFTTKDDIDVSEIAKEYNGGGHQKAAGFYCDKLPFLEDI